MPPQITFQPITIIGSVLQPQNRLFDLMALPPCVILANEATVTLSSMVSEGVGVN
jgi:hypothetical protein